MELIGAEALGIPIGATPGAVAEVGEVDEAGQRNPLVNVPKPETLARRGLRV